MTTDDSKHWTIMFQNLLKFKQRHGHCFVLYKYGALGKWVHEQKQQYKIYTSSSSCCSTSTAPCTLTRARIELLERHGFNWHFESTRDLKWHEMYVQLRTFREQNGHLRVSKKLKPKLGAWIDYQRVLYRQRQECCQEGDRAPTAAASSVSIPDHRVELLERIGFDWNYSPPTVTGENNFSNRDKPRLLDSSTNSSTSVRSNARQDCAGKRRASPLEMLSSVAAAEHKHKQKQPSSSSRSRSSMGPVHKPWMVPFRPVPEYPNRMPSPTSTAYFPPVPAASASRVLPSQGYVMSYYHPPVPAPAHAYPHVSAPAPAHGPAYPMTSYGSGQQRSAMSHNFYYPSRSMFRQKK
mmetsp:Transcript_10037/g.13048  ORF Transcript_10037/g.13048 Transcript_10037/m.13048 type:complete len:351 (-) Transcript_10037:69-1121(-)